MKNLAIASVAGLALAATDNAQTVVDLSGQGIQGTPMQVGSGVASGGITGIGFDISVSTVDPSWADEVIIDISGPSGFSFRGAGANSNFSGDPVNADLTFGWGPTAGTFSFSGTASVSGDAGTYNISAFDAFDDFPGSDNAVFLEGSSITLIPAPGAAALLGMGGLVATRRRR